MTNHTQADDILTVLKTSGDISGFSLAYRLNIPDASVRRAVGFLRKAGYDIRTGLRGYRLHETETLPTVNA